MIATFLLLPCNLPAFPAFFSLASFVLQLAGPFFFRYIKKLAAHGRPSG
jgi:hypothetical protein